MKKHLKYILIITDIGLLCLICLMILSLQYNTSLNYYLDISEKIFKEVVNIDRDKRLHETGESVHFMYIPNSKNTHTKIQREGELPVYIERTDSSRQLSHTIIQNNVIQSFLLENRPIDVEKFDALFNATLQEEKIRTKTAIQYTDSTTGKTYYSNPDTTSYKNYSVLNKVNTGLNNEITLQAFIRISPVTIIQRAIIPMSAITLTCLLLMIISVSIILRKKKTVEMPVIETSKRTYIQITDSISLNIDRNCLINNNKEIELTDMHVRFLIILLNSPDGFAAYETLISELYGNVEKKLGRDCLSQLVKRIRNEILVSVPGIELKNIPRKGYKLIVS